MSEYEKLKEEKEYFYNMIKLIKDMGSLIGRSFLYEDNVDVLYFDDDLCRSLLENGITNEDDIFKVVKSYEIKNKSFWSSYPSLFYNHPQTHETIEVKWNNGKKPMRGLLIGAD